jgi:hypothetical protein
MDLTAFPDTRVFTKIPSAMFGVKKIRENEKCARDLKQMYHFCKYVSLNGLPIFKV